MTRDSTEDSADATTTTKADTNLAPFNPSSETAQLQSIAMMDLTEDDILFDLGCGDGRLLTRAVSQVPGLVCFGVEIDPVFAERANKAVSQLPAPVQERIQIRCQDVTQILSPGVNLMKETTDSPSFLSGTKRLEDVSVEDATVIYLYLLPQGLRQIKTLLDELVERRLRRKESLRVVAYTFSVKGWNPVRVDRSSKSGVPIYLYKFP